MTNLVPLLPVSWYVGFDCPKPNCKFSQNLLIEQGGMRGTNLLDIDGNFYFWYIFGDISLQRLSINGLPHDTGHCELSGVIKKNVSQI